MTNDVLDQWRRSTGWARRSYVILLVIMGLLIVGMFASLDAPWLGIWLFLLWATLTVSANIAALLLLIQQRRALRTTLDLAATIEVRHTANNVFALPCSLPLLSLLIRTGHTPLSERIQIGLLVCGCVWLFILAVNTIKLQPLLEQFRLAALADGQPELLGGAPLSSVRGAPTNFILFVLLSTSQPMGVVTYVIAFTLAGLLVYLTLLTNSIDGFVPRALPGTRPLRPDEIDSIERLTGHVPPPSYRPRITQVLIGVLFVALAALIIYGLRDIYHQSWLTIALAALLIIALLTLLWLITIHQQRAASTKPNGAVQLGIIGAAAVVGLTGSALIVGSFARPGLRAVAYTDNAQYGVTSSSTLLAMLDSRDNIQFRETHTGLLRNQIAAVSYALPLAMGTDGSWIATRDRNMVVYRTSDGSRLAEIPLDESDPIFATDRSHVLVPGAGGTELRALPGGALVQKVGVAGQSVAVGPDGKVLIIGATVVDRVTGVRYTLPFTATKGAIAPDESELTICDRTGTAHRYRVADGQPLGTLTTTGGECRQLFYSPQGIWLTMISWDFEQSYQFVALDTRSGALLQSPIDDLRWVGVGPDDTFLLGTRTTIWRWWPSE